MIDTLPNAVVKALGQKRADSIYTAHERMEIAIQEAPSEGSWTATLQMPLKATTEAAAKQEFANRLKLFSPNGNWFLSVGRNSDGVQVGMASDAFILPEVLSVTDVPRFLVFDLHSRLGAWWLAHLWRAADLCDATLSALRHWTIIPAAACSRALLEGAAAFVIEGDELIRLWDDYKRTGPHDTPEAMAFRQRFNELLSQAQLGTRIGEKSQIPQPRLKRGNVLTILEKFIKKHADERVWESYEWLCDTVHPSLGSMSVYTDSQGTHKSGATFRAHVVRTAIKESGPPVIHPVVAWAAADMFALAVEHLDRQTDRIRWVLDDFGLTTGAAFSANAPLLGALVNPERNERCPCGSGQKAKSCHHEWGLPGTPPLTTAS